MGGRIMASTINADTSNGVIITPDTSGEIELQANGVTKAKVTANGLQDANGNSLRGGSFRNLLINGDMRIAQRGTSATSLSSNNYFTVDRWKAIHGVGLGVWTNEQSTDVPTGQGFSNSFKSICTTADPSPAASDIVQVIQEIEGQNMVSLKKGTSNAESVTLSFWVKSNITGTYTVEWRDSDNNRHICAAYTITASDTWEKKTITFAGDTVSAFVYDNSTCGNIGFCYGAGSNFTSGTLATSWASRNTANLGVGQVNVGAAINNYFQLTGVQLEVGEGASDFEFLPYDVQLQRCQRYYEKITFVDAQYFLICVHYITGTQSRGILPYSYKRTNPTITFNGSYTANPGPNQAVTPTANGASYTSSRIDCVTTNSGSIGTSIILLGYTSNNIEISAEL